MNTSSFIGQLTSGVLVEYFGIPAVLTGSTFGGTVLLFALIGLRTLASFVVIGILYGYSAGICKPSYRGYISIPAHSLFIQFKRYGHLSWLSYRQTRQTLGMSIPEKQVCSNV